MTKPLYFWNGSSFELVGPTTPQSPFAYQTSAPTAPATGDIWIDSDGDVDTYNRQLTRYYFVASAGQTSVSGTDANGLTLAYVAGSEQVYVNGALQVRGVDYTATNGTSITGLSVLALNDVVEVFAYTAFTVANAYTKSETDSVADAAPGLRMVVPTSVAVGSGSGSVSTSGAVTFSGASSVSINGCFSSTYSNYKILFDMTSAADSAKRIRLRVNNSDDTNNVYTTGFGYDQIGGAASGHATDGATQSWALMQTGSSRQTTVSFDLFNPFNTQKTTGTSLNVDQEGSGGLYLLYSGYNFSNTTSFTGFSLLISSSTASGTIRIYGYKD